MNKKTMKKSLAGFMVMAVLSGTMAPMATIFAADKKMTGNELEFRKLKTEQLEKAGQLKDFNSNEKIKTFSADGGLKKSAEMKQSQKQNFVEGEVLVKFKEQKINLEQSSGRTKAMQFAVSKNLDKKEDIRKSNISVLKTKGDESVEGMVERLKGDESVEYVQPNFLYYPSAIDTNDTYREKLWGLDNTGQEVNGVSGIPNADINIVDAWGISEGAESEDDIIVAVIDDGVAYNHPDLASNMWNGNTCIGSDKNGSPLSGGCLHGYDYEDNDLYPLPTSGSHGTHIAGTIGAVKNNNKGIIGVAPNVKIMALKVDYSTSQIVKSIDFAEQNEAKVINASWGCYGSDQGGTHAVCGGDYDYHDQAMINAIESFSGLFVAAAGNGNGDSDSDGDNHDSGQTLHSYPCDHTSENIICVAATNQDDEIASFSDYGATSVDVGAPGVNIYSTGFVQELFTDATLPSFTNTLFAKTSGSWRTGTWANVGGDVSDKNAQANSSYVNNDDGILTLAAPLDTTGYSNDVLLSFYLYADIEYHDLCLYDYLSVEVDNNDDNWVEKNWWCGGLWNEKVYTNLGAGSPSMRIRFIWHTDEIITKTQVPIIDDIVISNTHSYQYASGTSMATPHVAGLAALIWGYNSELSYSEVKDVILTTGDDLTSLAGKTTTGKRINAQKALQAANPAKAITAFSFATPAATGVINETAHTISITVPYGTDVTALVPTIATSTGATVSPASGVAQNFTSSVTYTVTAADSSTQAYVVTVNFDDNPDIALAAADKAALVDDSIKGANPDLSNITIALTNPLPALGANGSTITWVSNTPAVVSNDGQTINRPAFASGNATVTITATIAKGVVTDTKVFTLTVIKLPASAIATVTSGTYTVSAGGTASETIANIPFGTSKTIFLVALTKGEANQTWSDTNISDPVATDNTLVVTAEDGITTVTYTVTTALNPAKAITAFSFPEGVGVINEGAKTIAVTVPFSTDVSALVPTIVITGASVNPASGLAQDFTNSVTYIVTAADATTQIYTVTVTIALNTAKAITSFNFADLSATGVINEAAKTVSIIVPYDTDITALVPTISISGSSINPLNGIAQNFSIPVTYTVTAADSSTQAYIVTVTTALNPAKAITAFNFPEGVGVINEGTKTIAVTVPYGIDVTALVPTIVITGASVNPLSGVAQNFTSPVTYTVTAADSSTQAYVVTVAIAAPSDIATITSATYTVSAGGTAAETITNISFGTTKDTFLAALVKGHSGQTWVDTNISDPVATGNTLVVTAQDGTTVVTYTITVALNPAKSITSFNFASPSVMGVINETAHTITITVPYGTDVTALAPTIATSTGATVSPASGVAQDFTNLVTYTVTAADTTTQTYIVTVNIVTATQTVPIVDGTATANSTTPQVVISSPTQAVTVTVSSGTSNASINYGSLISGGTGTIPQTTINSASADIAIPASTVVTSADSTWNGIIAAPIVTTVTLPETSGQTKTLSTAIEVGFTGAKLSFDKAVRILLPGQADKKAGYIRTGIAFTEITTACGADTQVAGDALAVDKDCKIDVGPDLVIWTKHFTKFATYTQTTVTQNSGGGSPAPVLPTNILISIAAGAATTTTRNVTLTLGATNAIQMMISNSSDFTGASWMTYATLKEWTLTSGNGTKTVYVKFQNASGSNSSVVSDSIMLLESEGKAPDVKGKVPSAESVNILDGDIIQCKSCSNPFAVYIVKIVGNTKYIRHVVSIEIFNHYKHLKWENLKQVSSLNKYSLSGWVRYNTGANNTAAPTDKVYEINGDQSKHWINMTAEQFLSHGGSDPAIFNINQGELNLYIAGADVMSL